LLDRRAAEGVLREKEKNLKKHLTFMPDSRKRKYKAAGHQGFPLLRARQIWFHPACAGRLE